MKVAVKDANIFIDMESMGIFDLWQKLGYQTLTTSLIVQELEAGGHQEAIAYIEADTIQVRDPSLESTEKLFNELSRISLPDASVLCLALETKALLLTGDRTLRIAGEVRQVEVHGSIWILDQLVQSQLLPGPVAAEKLSRLHSQVGARMRFFPEKLIAEFCAKWRTR